jgi:hypothetical protein
MPTPWIGVNYIPSASLRSEHNIPTLHVLHDLCMFKFIITFSYQNLHLYNG